MLVVIITINLKRKYGLLLHVTGSFTILTTCRGYAMSYEVKKILHPFLLQSITKTDLFCYVCLLSSDEILFGENVG